MVKIQEEKLWKVESYKILLTDEKLAKLNYNYIRLVVEYYFSETNKDAPGVLEKIEIRIGNTREGSTPILQKEIDLLADSIEKTLTNRFGSSNFSIERKIVTPM